MKETIKIAAFSFLWPLLLFVPLHFWFSDAEKQANQLLVFMAGSYNIAILSAKENRAHAMIATAYLLSCLSLALHSYSPVEFPWFWVGPVSLTFTLLLVRALGIPGLIEKNATRTKAVPEE